MVLEGRFRGGKTPYGYRLEKSGILNKRKHEVNRLAIDNEEAEVVRMMFDLSLFVSPTHQERQTFEWCRSLVSISTSAILKVQ